jgi:hypothetical protein
MHPETGRRKIIVMHGWGGTLGGALECLRTLLRFEARWADGGFYVEPRTGSLLRQLLADLEGERCLRAFQKLAVSRLLNAAPAAEAGGGLEALYRLDESDIRETFARFGLPISPAFKAQRARVLETEAAAELGPMLRGLERVAGEALHGGWPAWTEAETRRRILAAGTGGQAMDAALRLVESVRQMQETGGDLDTVGSAALYAYWLQASAEARGETCAYGRCYRYAFLNYHESLLSLKHLGPADLYLADLPIGAFPEFEPECRALADVGIRVRRYEDHHPCTPEQRAALGRLRDDGILEFFEMSGPAGTEEPDPDTLRCATDMVYDNVIRGTPWDCAGARTLRDAAHAEDFVKGRTAFGRLLTDLIKGGQCKVEIVQTLVDGIPGDDGAARVRANGWETVADAWRRETDAIRERLLEHAYVLTLADSGVRILAALAVHAAPGSARMTVGKAQEFYAEKVPEADYLFYCYGSGLLVARRLNQADVTLNLAELMRRIGSPGDGGHGGAAVARPERHPRYPRRTLGTIRAGRFGAFVRYLSARLGESGFPVGAIRSRSVAVHVHSNASTRRLGLVALVAVAVGILTALLNPRFRPRAILESNADFLPALPGMVQDAEDGDGEDGP